MNSTSFTSADPNGAGQDKNIDSSSTAHLTLNAAIGSSAPDAGSTCRLTRGSDSEPDGSPKVTVLGASGNGHHRHLQHNFDDDDLHQNLNLNHNHSHHSHRHRASSLPRPAQLLAGGFSFSNRLHLTTKHQRTLWSRATHFEKILMLALAAVSLLSVVLFISLGSIVVRQRSQLRELTAKANSAASNASNRPPPPSPPPPTYNPQRPDKNGPPSGQLVPFGDNGTTRNYCLTPNCVKVAASVIEAIDLSVDPCDDFYVSVSSL